MTQEQKELLLKDLCARLPYGVKFMDLWNPKESPTTLCDINVDYDLIMNTDGFSLEIEKCKPYLFPLSSMNEEIMDEIYNNTGVYDIDIDSSVHIEVGTTFEDLTKIFDILHKHNIDYRGLIPMGLANDATGLNIY